MKVEIWSDIMCPFCYIGKRKFEAAMENFSDAGSIEVTWHSFQLDPTIQSGQDKDLNEYLAERKGWSPAQARQMNDHVTKTASESGLKFNLDDAVVANSFDAHRIIQLAQKQDLGDAMEERLFKAYFTEGKDVSDHGTLIELAEEIGLERNIVTAELQENKMEEAVKADIREAQKLGINGVPFFVLNRKYGISGAQPSEVFLKALTQSFSEWRTDNPPLSLDIAEGSVCTPDGECS